jgi:limonene-1,2-epoxide hydrolase
MGQLKGGAFVDDEEVVRSFLAAMERRDLDAAREHLAPGFAMTFPGGVRMTALEELVAWARPRYRSIGKSYERFDLADGGVLWCFGTLAGEFPDGGRFEGVCFVDRFELSGGRIVRQDVWNDLCEVRP